MGYQVLQTSGVPAKIWVDDLGAVESQALDQIRNMAQLPTVVGVAVMPDVHLGKGAVVGGVVATQGIVVPNIVGVDIGCGICAVDTGVVWDRQKMGKNFWRQFSGFVMLAVPTGFNRHRTPQKWSGLKAVLRAKPLQIHLRDTAAYQLGTLGGGNHFLEAQFDPQTDHLWLMVHSGSRGTGLKIAMHYSQLAREWCGERRVKTAPDLEFLRLADQSGEDYLHDMNWAIGFALENRYRMMEAMVAALIHTCAHFGVDTQALRAIGRQEVVNIHHNFASIETHRGRQVVVHRKGATQARAGQTGIVPGSMGTPSYIVVGLGNEDSFMSCSHGAGRRLSRHRARAEITATDFQKAIAKTFTKASPGYLDEAPQAYKDVEQVMAWQTDLARIKHQLWPIITVKGDSKAKEN